MPTVTPADSSPDVIAVLTARVAELQRTQVTEDVAGFLSLFDAEAVWVTGGGVLTAMQVDEYPPMPI